MWSSRRGCLAPVLAVLCLTGCSTVGHVRAGLPLAAPSCIDYLPFPWEIRATMNIQRGEETTNLLAAIATAQSGAKLALLTPQGIPLYRFTCSQGEWEIARQVRSDLPVKPERLVAWLQLVYLEQTRVPQFLRPGWAWSDSGGVREFYPPGGVVDTPPSIRIEHGGSGPWYATARLDDNGLGARLVVQILEATRGLSE